MTPQEKAKELVYKYQYLVNTWDCYNDESLEMIYRLPDMKRCALISVDEIINELDDIMNFTGINYCSEVIKYWQEVKQEIEKL